MALTDQEKHNIIYYLGWPAKMLIEGTTHTHKTFRDRLANLNSNSEVIIRKVLRRLESLDTKLEEASCRFATEQVGSGSDAVKLNKDERKMLLLERKRGIREISRTVDIPVADMASGVDVIV